MKRPVLIRPSLVALAYVLRNKERWPSDFIWDYRFPAGCPLGLYFRVWQATPNFNVCLGISEEESNRIILHVGAYRDVPDEKVTPEMCADEIDLIIQEQVRRRIQK
jgi:hypothetical protein